MQFEEKLKAARKEQGLTQEEMASKLCVSRADVAKWESGVSHFSAHLRFNCGKENQNRGECVYKMCTNSGSRYRSGRMTLKNLVLLQSDNLYFSNA